ncbi:MAG: prepilin peptidase [Devosia sp.]|nr:prepilin peptidase [Devosia sp.]
MAANPCSRAWRGRSGRRSWGSWVLERVGRPLPVPLPYEERRAPAAKGIERVLAGLAAWLGAATRWRHLPGLRSIVGLVNAHGAALAALPAEQLAASTRDLARRLRGQRRQRRADVAESLAIVRETAARRIDQQAYDVQVLGAYAMLSGFIAQMATGEGKTLTAVLAAGCMGLSGRPVHVVTVNDYLARRDAEYGRPVYEALGLSVGVVVTGQSFAERRAAYAADIVYCTNKELTFDYLRDRIVLGARDSTPALKFEALREGGSRLPELRLRGLHFALVDEADSVLIDEARTPLIISAQTPSPVDPGTAEDALGLAAELQPGRHYEVVASHKRIVLTPAGRDAIAEFAEGRGQGWRGVIRREELMRQALSALLLFHRDQQYLVRDGKVVIIDEHTGRAMPDRSWSDGLHQLIEIKEGCQPSPARTTIARMTYQRFFRRYLLLSGMTGTAAPVATELKAIYGTDVVAIPTHRKVRRVVHRPRVFPTAERKWHAVVSRVGELHRLGVPVLIGTHTVAASLDAGRRLTAAGLPHTVLSARQDEAEADTVAAAGLLGAITVATNMAGRGTDIKLGPGVEALGGLHVLMTERHEARRIDLQLAGRSARQGQPGCFEAYLSLEDDILADGPGAVLAGIARTVRPLVGEWPGRVAVDVAQWRLERVHHRMRSSLLKSDEMQSTTMAFSGRPE